MNKKSFLTLLLALSLGLNMLAACGGEGDKSSAEDSSSTESVSESVDSSAEEHVHQFSVDWKKNIDTHYHICSCGVKTDVEEHVGEVASCTEKPVCTVCGKKFGTVKGHTYTALTELENGVKGYACDCGESIPLVSYESDGVTVEGVVDFLVEVEEDRDPVILQLSDPQICNWGDVNKMCYNYIRETVTATDPDLILVTGDLIYGKFDDSTGSIFTDYVEFMDSLQVPWAPVFGNHDNECPMGVDWQCEQLENAEYCLFEQRDLTGNGNYSVGVMQGGKLLRAFYMMDSNGCGNPSAASVGKVRTIAGFANNQISWFSESITTLKGVVPDVKISFAYHIQQMAFLNAFQKYEEYDGLNTNSVLTHPLDLDTMETAEEGDFGYLGRTLKGPWDTSNTVFELMKSLGVDSLFVGHEHCNSASIVWEGIRFQFGQKSSTYDRYNYLKSDGSIVGDYNAGSGDTPLIGGTAFKLSKTDGAIVDPYIYLCGDPFGKNPKAA